MATWSTYGVKPKSLAYKILGNKIVKAIAHDMGTEYRVVWKPPSTYEGPTWDGTTLRNSSHPEIYGIHDVAHLMEAPKCRRHLPEFGLGTDPGGSYPYEYDDYLTIDLKRAEREEWRVCDLHWGLAAYGGGLSHASLIEDHLNMNESPTVTVEAINRMQKYVDRGWLPDNFLERVLKVQAKELKRDSYGG